MLQWTRAGFSPTMASIVCASIILQVPHQLSILSPGLGIYSPLRLFCTTRISQEGPEIREGAHFSLRTAERRLHLNCFLLLLPFSIKSNPNGPLPNPFDFNKVRPSSNMQGDAARYDDMYIFFKKADPTGSIDGVANHIVDCIGVLDQ